MLLFELLTGKKPYFDVTDVMLVTYVTQRKLLPNVPKEGVSPLFSTFHPLIRECQNETASKRPTAAALMEKIDALRLRIAAAAITPSAPANQPPTVSS